MDILLGAHQGPPLVLRNNGDGSFTAIQPSPAFPACVALPGLTWMETAIPMQP